MSKLIVEMEMPQACPCDLIGIGYAMCCSAANSKKRIVEYDECVKNGTRPDWCPIKGELPEEHGDLIDRDALLETCIYYYINPNKGAVDTDNIQDMPVIIAAERRET